MLTIIEAFLLYLFNGLTFEFGDDLYCWAAHELTNIQIAVCRAGIIDYADRLGHTAPYSAFAGTLVGYAVTPLSLVLSALSGRPKSAGDAFARGLGLELVEGTLSVIGQMITDPNLAIALWSLGLSAVIGPVRGSVSAFTFSWNNSAGFRFLIVIAVAGALAIALIQMGVLSV